MVSVYVRHEADDAGVLLGQFNPIYLDILVEKFKHYTTHVKDADDEEAGFVAAQFAVGENGAYFEIIVGNRKRK